jgi:hypothetical protein
MGCNKPRVKFSAPCHKGSTSVESFDLMEFPDVDGTSVSPKASVNIIYSKIPAS